MNSSLPSDFSQEEIEFADILANEFDIEQEQLPPFFIETVYSEPKLPLVSGELENRILQTVFSRLRLTKEKVPAGATSPNEWIRLLSAELIELTRSIPRWSIVSNRLHVSLTSAIAIGLLSAVIFTSTLSIVPTFAATVAAILHRAGIYQVTGARSTPVISKQIELKPRPADYEEVQRRVDFQMQWPGSVPHGYLFNSLGLYNKSYAVGPVVELTYLCPSCKKSGTGMISIIEFKAENAVSVLKVVEEGYWSKISVGRDEAIYIDGRWSLFNHEQYWESGTENTIIYEHNSLVFWISGDQRDHITREQLSRIARSLQTPLPIPFNRRIALLNSSLLQENRADDVVAITAVDSEKVSTKVITLTSTPTGR